MQKNSKNSPPKRKHSNASTHTLFIIAQKYICARKYVSRFSSHFLSLPYIFEFLFLFSIYKQFRTKKTALDLITHKIFVSVHIDYLNRIPNVCVFRLREHSTTRNKIHNVAKNTSFFDCLRIMRVAHTHNNCPTCKKPSGQTNVYLFYRNQKKL